MSAYQKWLWFSPLGLGLIGAGVSLAIHAGSLRTQGEGWFALGTIGLLLLNSGIALVADAIKNRVLYEIGLNPNTPSRS